MSKKKRNNVTQVENNDTQVENNDTQVENNDTQVENNDTQVENNDTQVENNDTQVENNDASHIVMPVLISSREITTEDPCEDLHSHITEYATRVAERDEVIEELNEKIKKLNETIEGLTKENALLVQKLLFAPEKEKKSNPSQISAKFSEYVKQNQSPNYRFVGANLNFSESSEDIKRKDTRKLVDCGIYLQRSHLRNITFSNFRLHNSNMNYSNLYESTFLDFDFLNVRMIAGDFQNVVFEGVTFENVDMQRCFFEACEFKDCHFIGSNMTFALFDSECVFNNVKISNCHTEYMTLPKSLKENIAFERTHLDKVNFK